MQTFVTLRALGHFDFDEHESATYEETSEHDERTKNIKPSSLIEPRPKKA